MINLNGVKQKLKICAGTHLVSFNASGIAYVDYPEPFAVNPYLVVNLLGGYLDNFGGTTNQLSLLCSNMANRQAYIKYIAVGY